jgi:hypothetical protein
VPASWTDVRHIGNAYPATRTRPAGEEHPWSGEKLSDGHYLVALDDKGVSSSHPGQVGQGIFLRHASNAQTDLQPALVGALPCAEIVIGLLMGQINDTVTKVLDR